MSRTFQHLCSPLELGSHILRNRIVFGAHTSNMAVDGIPGDRHVAYYAERAIGGAAMIVVEPMPVHAAAVLTRGNFRHSDDSVIPHFRKVTDAIKSNGAVAIQQLYHVGANGDSDLSFHPHWSPSGLPSYHDSDGSHAMTGQKFGRRSTALYRRHDVARKRVLMALRSGPPISAWSTSSGLHGAIAGKTNGVVRSRIEPAFRGKSSLESGMPVDRISLSALR